MPLITINELHMGFRGPPLLDGVSCIIDPRQHIGLLGRNGAGKTTFMRILSGELIPDDGQVVVNPGTKIALLPQGVPQDLFGTVTEIVTQGLQPGDHDLEWEGEHKAEQIIAMMELDPAARFEELSSGMKRRVLLARSLVCAPDVLLLDEPTNHLDIDAIRWLEGFLSKWPSTLLFVTHDRVFLQKLADRIIEIDRGRLFDWSCDYATFLVRKQLILESEDRQNQLFDRKLADEEVWIRTGIKARRTRNEGRVRALEKMRSERASRRELVGRTKLTIQEGQRSGALVAEVEDVSFSYGDREIFSGFSTSVMRGDKIGIIGPNGAGKTTLLRVLLGQLEPTAGKVRLGTNQQIAYFDQLRQQLDEEASVQVNVGEGYDTVQMNGGSRHIIGYLQDFLFSPDRARTLVKYLSGGERNRVLLAKMFSRPANIIVLDEPTNDLDTETLELLEERLVEFDGTILMVSHDRAFLNNVVTSTIVFEDDTVKEYVGGYDDWQRQKAANVVAETARTPKSAGSAEVSPAKQRRLSFQEKKEWSALPGQIEKLEVEIANLHQEMSDPKFYQQSPDNIRARQIVLKKAEDSLATAYDRWSVLGELVE